MKRLFLLTGMWLSILSNYVFAQNQNSLMRTDLIAPSPTAANLGKYGDVPVTYYTGMPNVSIPLFTVTGNELSLPITLTYNYNGLQPSQKASWVGLGWSLQAGGVITRTIGDKIDDLSGYDRDSASQISPTQTYMKRSYAFNMFDNKPDVYNFNFGNYSGKFIMYGNEAYIMPFQKLKITGNGSSGFTIVTEDGTKYEFTERELTSPRISEGSPYQLPTYASAYYLTKITNAANTESIRLTYAPDGTMLQFGVKAQSYNKLVQQTYTESYKVTPPAQPGPPHDVFPTRVAMVRLASITSEKYSVIFRAGAQRSDLEVEQGTARVLESIEIHAREAFVKQIDFDYDYFGNGTGPHKRFLKLRTVTDRGATSNHVFNQHAFEYYNETGSFGEGVMSYVDRFGYVKGAGQMPNNMYFTPDIYPLGVDRSPNVNAMTAGALRKIKYPTGGHTMFLYEGNIVFDGEKYLKHAHTASPLDPVRQNPSTTNQITNQIQFQINQPHMVKLWYSRSPKSLADPPPAEVPHNNVEEIQICPVYNLVDDEGNSNGETIGAPIKLGEIIFNADNGGKWDSVYIAEPGKYVLKVICDANELSASGVVHYTEFTNTPIEGKKGPGIRMRQMSHHTGAGDSTVTLFSYKDDNGFSTGRLLRGDVYSVKDFEDRYRSTNLGGAIVCVNTFLAYSSVLSEGPGAGLPFYYTKVVENRLGGPDVHRSSYEFDYFSGTQKVEMIKHRQFLNSNNNFIELSSTTNSFSNEVYDEAFAAMDVYVAGRYIIWEGQDFTSDFYNFSHDLYQVAWLPPKSSTSVLKSGSTELVSESRQYFDSNRNLIGRRTSNSDGTSTYVRYKYPENYSGIGWIDDMAVANMLSQVIEEQTWKKRPAGDSVMIGGRINVYANRRLFQVYVFETSNGVAQLTAEQKDANGLYTTAISDSRYTLKVQFNYDAAGRLIQQQVTDQPPVSYVWGYPGIVESGSSTVGMTFPIAEIQNATPSQVFYTSFEDGGQEIETPMGTKAHAGSFTIPGSFAGKYVLTYWKKSLSGVWELFTENLQNPSNVNIQSTTYIDEVRLIPETASIKTFTFLGDKIIRANDPNNRISRYEYDQMGRLVLIRDELGNILQAYKYHIKDETHPTNEQ